MIATDTRTRGSNGQAEDGERAARAPDEPVTFGSHGEFVEAAVELFRGDSVKRRLIELETDREARAQLDGQNIVLAMPEDATRLPLIKTEWTVRDFLEYGTVGFLNGRYGSGKSFLALDWACCTATGQDWLGHKTRKSHVLYLAAEGGPGQAKRVAAWQQIHGNLAEDSIIFLRKPMDIADDAVKKHISRLIKQYGTTLLIIDTLARSIGGRNEDSAKEMAPVINALQEYRDVLGEAETTVLVLHHLGWGDQTRGRGSSRLPSDTDFSYLLRKDASSGAIKLHGDKLKENDPPDDTGLRLRKVPLECAWNESSCVIERGELIEPTEATTTPSKASSKDRPVLDHLKDHPGATGSQVTTATRQDPSNTSKQLRRLKAEGRVRSEPGEGVSKRWFVVGVEAT